MNIPAIMILLGSFFLLIFFSVPIAYAMVSASVITFLYLGISLTTVINTMIGGINGFTFLAIPFFVLAGDIMANGGISDRLITLSRTMVGWMRGGLALVDVLASMFFGGISGSATADAASLGTILIPMMRKDGYDAEFSTSVTMASSVQGLLIPPSHNMIIYATAAGGVSVAGLFMAGIVPGVFLGIVLMIFCYILSVKRKYPKGNKFCLPALLKALKASVLGLMTVLIVVFGVVTGIFTPTESAAIAVVYAFIVSFFVYREIPLGRFLSILSSSIKTLANVLILIAAAGTFGYLVAYLKVPSILAHAILGITTNTFIILLLINIVLLLLGTIMGMASIIVIMTPILIPIVTQLGMSPVQFGIIMILNCGIGLLTPPVGGVLFIGSGLSGVKIEDLVKEMLPFYVVMTGVLLAVTYIAPISMALPHLLGL
jgi:tripartite ATP-independent transporter DctM subunit